MKLNIPKYKTSFIIGFTILVIEFFMEVNGSLFLEFTIRLFFLLCSVAYFIDAFEEYTGFKIK